MKSTCMKCGGVDAYKKSKFRDESQESVTMTDKEIDKDKDGTLA